MYRARKLLNTRKILLGAVVIGQVTLASAQEAGQGMPDGSSGSPAPSVEEESVPGDTDLTSEPEAEDGFGSLEFAGYNKTLIIGSHTLEPEDEGYGLWLNRTRIKLTYDLPPHLEVHLENDTELRFGSYLKTGEFKRRKQVPRRQYWDLQSTIKDENGYNITNDFFRAYVKWSQSETDVVLGRQRIPLGTGRIWSTLDKLNPINPLQIERDEYVGVDALMVEQKLGALSKLAAIYAPDPLREDDRFVFQYRTNWEGTDIDVILGRYWTDNLVGVDFATQIGDMGFHGEAAFTDPGEGDSYGSMVLGVDYAFPNTFNISVEGYYSSQKESDRLKQFQDNPLRLFVEPFDTRYLGLNINYEFTPLIKGNLYYLNNVKDGSSFISPFVTYSVTDNLTLQVGAQLFTGSDNSDYGRFKPVYYGQVQWFF
jgi:hypothetical protein